MAKSKRHIDNLNNENGRNHVSMEYVKQVVTNYVQLPLGAINAAYRDFYVGMLLANLIIPDEGGGIYFNNMRENLARTVGEYLLEYCGVASVHKCQSTSALMTLGMLSVTERYAVARYFDETHFYDCTNAEYDDQWNIPEECKLVESSVDEDELDELFYTVTLPFLRLPLVAYLEYLNTIPELEKLHLYEAWFQRDVEAWRDKYGSEPTIADVLYRAIDRFRLFKENYGTFDLVDYTVFPVLYGEIPADKPFARLNPQGECWPPHDEEGALAGTWIWLIMVLGPCCVFRSLVALE